MNNFSITTFDDILRSKYWFDRSFKEREGYQCVVLENGNGQLVANVLGINPEDIQITVETAENPGRQILKISGKSEVLDHNFEVNYVFIVKPVKVITPTIKNGLLVIELEWEKPAVPSVEIKKLVA